MPPLRPSLAAALAAVLLAAAAAGQSPRQVAAPPEDLLSGRLRLPQAEALLEQAAFALLPLDFAATGASTTAELELPLPGGEVVLALLAPDLRGWSVAALEPGAGWSPLGARSAARAGQGAALDGTALAVARFDVPSAAAGTWRVRVEAPAGSPTRGAWLLARADAAPLLASGPATLELTSDATIHLLARLEGPLARMTWASVALESPAGARRLALADDGLHGDGAAGDGTFGAPLPPWTSGDVRARVVVHGELESGAPFVRTGLHAFHVHERPLLLDGGAAARVRDARTLDLEVGAWILRAERKLQVAAELWGTDAGGALVPVCWLARMQTPAAAGPGALELSADGRWLARAGAREPLQLRAVRVQDPDTHALLAYAERIVLAPSGLPAAALAPPGPIEPSMLAASLGTGALGPAAPATPAVARALMLVHGYCSGGSIWPKAHFSQPKLEFLDPDQNRTNDQFALLLAQAGAGRDSFGVVAHSQGGLAALHLLTYYDSGLDRAFGGRRIQSVASPYQGTPLASWGGFACGVNNDMTPSGAAAWLAGIPSWARAEVFYWTTQDAGSACNAFTSLLLSDPEDGTVERFRGQLPGGNSMGHAVGWCHTTGMSYPASYTDAVRNAQMDAAAAR